MCGIAGQVDLGGTGAGWLEWAGAMAASLAHRGPDGCGVWVDPAGGAALAHRRLAVLDLSADAAQPMHSVCGRYVTTFNGEIYNFRELARSLAARGHRFRGRSDTEVLLAAIAEWGIDGALARFDGMFAFAVWDRVERLLFLARDRFGEKPLYYGRFGRAFLFGSELRALRAHPAFSAVVDSSALAQYLRFSCVPAPASIFEGVYKLPPGSWLRIDAGRAEIGGVETYWSAAAAAATAAMRPFHGSEADAEQELDSRLRASVSTRLVADVPVGAFLSGGVDSSSIVALMQAVSREPVRTFTIGFEDTRFNEADYARSIALHLGTRHAELCVTPGEALAVVPQMPAIYDEPFADSSQLPTYLVSKLARCDVTVALTGDGGDELFGGYTRYVWADAIWRVSGRLSSRVRAGLARALRTAGGPFLKRSGSGERVRRLDRLSDALGASSMEELYLGLVSQWADPSAVVRSAHASRRPALSGRSSFADVRARMMLLDTGGYLPDDILVKMDRASMAVGLETRVPFLDPRLFEFAWSLPVRMKIRGRSGKRILRRVLRRYVPPGLTDRPKMGFAAPIDAWLRGALREWAESLLDERSLAADGFLDPRPIRRRWAETLAGADHGQQYLWNVLMFQAWLREVRAARPAALAFMEAR